MIKRFGNTLHFLSLGPAFFATEQAVKDITNFLNKFSTELLRPKQSRNFNIIETKIFELSFESLIAVNSLLYIIYDFQGNLINDLTNFSKTPAPIFLNVFPQAGKTFILFSWLLNDSKIYQAYRLGLTKIINERYQDVKTKDLLILDEPTDGFSQQQVNRMQEIFDTLNTAQMIIISHERSLDSFITDIFTFKKGNHQTKVVKEIIE